ncbi:hypothetical protein [Geoalkalibacter halelectricus]|uniref:hypothetical protein n=1 Tax=Geoalkalibacter halelectricus TaxID=2847045 RepID=UPI00266F7A08|nr:hypothetical protein [Geoalkalibacter halelectricus]MDO3379510.1 hypothetical protein [Geoalkalibacter halelectricus]
MTDRFTDAVKELQDKSSFICTTCQPHEIPRGRETSEGKHMTGVHDRFSEAVAEEGEKSAFICERCGH